MGVTASLFPAVRSIPVPHSTAKSRARALLPCLLVATCVAGLPAFAQPAAVDGLLDLREWDFVEDGPAGLVGEWRFYWQELLPPNCRASHTGALQTLPDGWTGQIWDGRELPGIGHATYCLRVRLPADRTDPLVLKLPRVRTSGELWINGRSVASSVRSTGAATSTRTGAS